MPIQSSLSQDLPTASRIAILDLELPRVSRVLKFVQNFKVGDLALHAYTLFFRLWVHKLALHWRHPKRFSTAWCYIFVCLCIFVSTFVIKAINAVDTGALMISSEHEEILGVFNFVCQHQADGFNRLFSTIYVISQEQIVCLSRKSCVFK